MGYMHIDNLYRRPEFIRLFKEVWVLEKIHGTSAHIKISPHNITFFSGGVPHDEFVKLFDEKILREKYEGLNVDTTCVIYGEAYGGKCQGMSDVYGKELKFVAFDVKFITDNHPNGYWMDVPNAAKFVDNFGIEFVWHSQAENTLEQLDYYKNIPSMQSLRNISLEDGESEGVVVRPLYECNDKFGKRWIVKHKRDKFRETKTPRQVDPDQLIILGKANEVADEWVTQMRLAHVLDKIEQPHDITKTSIVVRSMIDDVKREGDGEIVWSKDVEKAIGKKAAELYKQRFQ